jgi:hypothetical protein
VCENTLVRKLRFAFALVLLAVWLGAPAMACLIPFHQLTQDEMACCAKMQGDCDGMADMGAGRSHSCCKKVQPHAAPIAIAAGNFHFIDMHVEVSWLYLPQEPLPSGSAAAVALFPAIHSHSPPGIGSSTILRI